MVRENVILVGGNMNSEIFMLVRAFQCLAMERQGIQQLPETQALSRRCVRSTAQKYQDKLAVGGRWSLPSTPVLGKTRLPRGLRWCQDNV